MGNNDENDPKNYSYEQKHEIYDNQKKPFNVKNNSHKSTKLANIKNFLCMSDNHQMELSYMQEDQNHFSHNLIRR